MRIVRSSYITHMMGIIILLLLTHCGDSDSITSETRVELNKTELIAPEDHSEQSTTSVSLQWQEVEEAELYQVQLSPIEDFSSLMVDDTSDSTSMEVEGLPQDSTVFWRVRALDQARTGPWSDTYTFTTLSDSSTPEPQTTTLKSPSDGAHDVETTITLRWTTIAEATGYQVELATDQNFASTVIDVEVETSSYEVSNLDNNQTYYWRVEPVLEHMESAWSETFRFSTESANSDTTSPGSREIRLMPLGDSITEAFGYRIPLWNKLTAEGYTINYVGSQSDEHPDLPDPDHEGHGGWSIGHIANEINGWLDAHQPNYIMLMIGTNDVAWWSARNGAQIADAHAQLVDQILSNSSTDTWLLVASIPPQSSKIIEPNNVDRAELAKEFNAEMEKRMQQRINNGAQIVFVDIHSQLTVNHLSDGIHPNKEGYEIIAQTWFEALLTVLP